MVVWCCGRDDVVVLMVVALCGYGEPNKRSLGSSTSDTSAKERCETIEETYDMQVLL